MSRTVVVDAKNFALYTGGISEFARPLIREWIRSRSDLKFILVGPKPRTALPLDENVDRFYLPWPKYLPRPLRHPFYDNVMFPAAIRSIAPDLVFSPYHDVRLPARIPSVMIIHDTCIADLPDVYPLRIRAYYETMLKVNLRRSSHLITVSEASRQRIISRYGVADARLTVVPNALGADFSARVPEIPLEDNAAALAGGKTLFYPGGGDRRKNILRLLEALELLNVSERVTLLVTGEKDDRWRSVLERFSAETTANVTFLGRLSAEDVRRHYLATNAAVYPSLCEGFGRVCLEAMELGTPIACSDLPVLHEVAGDYPTYFDPYDTRDIVEKLRRVLSQGKQQPRHDARFDSGVVTSLFVRTMDNILLRA